jgi:hypothetical protein
MAANIEVSNKDVIEFLFVKSESVGNVYKMLENAREQTSEGRNRYADLHCLLPKRIALIEGEGDYEKG